MEKNLIITACEKLIQFISNPTTKKNPSIIHMLWFLFSLSSPSSPSSSTNNNQLNSDIRLESIRKGLKETNSLFELFTEILQKSEEKDQKELVCKILTNLTDFGNFKTCIDLIINIRNSNIN
jgi:hypothetical protein